MSEFGCVLVERKLASATIALAEAFGLEAVAEGAQTPAAAPTLM